MKIYFKTERGKIDNIEKLLKVGYSRYGGAFKPTYRDPELTIQECHPARRSFDDLLTICRTYFPKTTKKELAKLIFKLNNDINLGGSFCCTIEKPVFFKRKTHIPIETYFGGYEQKRKGNSKYSFRIIKQLADVES